jgi:hypothetical protein
VALAAVGLAAFGDEILGEKKAPPDWSPRAQAPGSEATLPADEAQRAQTTLANRPSNEPALGATASPQPTGVREAPARTLSPGTLPPGTLPPGTLPPETLPARNAKATARPPADVPPAGGAASDGAETIAAEAGDADEATRDKAAERDASPESQLAAAAARHVMAGRYSDALPLYQRLAQSAPQNTAYAAMTRVLGQRLAAAKHSPDAPGGSR